MSTETTPAQQPTSRGPFDVNMSLVWLDLIAEGGQDTFTCNSAELQHLLLSYVEVRKAYLKTGATLNALNAQCKVMLERFTEMQDEIAKLRLANADMRDALPSDWEPARIRNERDALATVPQDVANATPQGDPGDETPSNSAAVAAE